MKTRTPVLLLGAGTGEATCGIVYLAGFLRRNDVEAWVKLYDADESEQDIERELKHLIKHVRPQLVGISLKWFHHLARAQFIAQTLRKIDPQLTIVLGGNTATYFWKELIALPCVDHIVLGDGEVPLLALCRGEPNPPNVVSRPKRGLPVRPPLTYVQSASGNENYYSHFKHLFLSQVDLHSFSGWVAPGKGCGENCAYCGGTRGMQKATFGRAKPFLRPTACVQQDHREIAPHTWQLRYDFAGSSAAFLKEAWGDVDLSRHSTTYFLWGVPPIDLMETLANTFAKVFMVLDIGCFSETQRLNLRKRGLLKPCPTDSELQEVITQSRRYSNLELEISGIAGLPYASAQTLKQERRLAEELLRLDCTVGYQRLEAQPGALITEHPERFEMVSEATTFTEFLKAFKKRGVSGDGTVPMVRFTDVALETAVQSLVDEIDETVHAQAAKRAQVKVTGRSKLTNASATTTTSELGAWLGSYRVPARLSHVPVTTIRSDNGTGLVCAPELRERRLFDPAIEQGSTAAALLAVFDAFTEANTVSTAVAHLKRAARLEPELSLEIISHLVEGRFLQVSRT